MISMIQKTMLSVQKYKLLRCDFCRRNESMYKKFRNAIIR